MAKVRLSPAMTRALKAIAEGDTRIHYITHRRQWVTVHGLVVAHTTMMALQVRRYVEPIGRLTQPPKMRSRRLTAIARDWLEGTD
jgi:hypothetical protein